MLKKNYAYEFTNQSSICTKQIDCLQSCYSKLFNFSHNHNNINQLKIMCHFSRIRLADQNFGYSLIPWTCGKISNSITVVSINWHKLFGRRLSISVKTLSVHTLTRDFNVADSAKWECRSGMGEQFGF